MKGIHWDCIYCKFETTTDSVFILIARIMEHKKECEGWKKRKLKEAKKNVE